MPIKKRIIYVTLVTSFLSFVFLLNFARGSYQDNNEMKVIKINSDSTVVANKGQIHGITKKSVYSINRLISNENTIIARAQVLTIEDSTCALKIGNQVEGKTVQPGDILILSVYRPVDNSNVQNTTTNTLLSQKELWYNQNKKNEKTAATLAIISPLLGFSYIGKPITGVLFEAIRDVSIVLAFKKGFDETETEKGFYTEYTISMNETGYLMCALSAFAVLFSYYKCTEEVGLYNQNLRKQARTQFGVIPKENGFEFNVVVSLKK